MNWHARPLVGYQVIIDLISATTTKTGLKVICELDDTLKLKPDIRSLRRFGAAADY
jgi:2-C-methyl-D-erythritol 4-phosphate cytidylyltransferase